MLDRDSKRNYIRRKKYLDETTNQIKTTLEFIAIVGGETPNSSEIQKAALLHAQGIEAACWSPRPRPTAEAYQQLISVKTAELCRVLTKQAIPGFDFAQLSKLASLKLSLGRAPEAAFPQVESNAGMQFSPKGDLPNVTLAGEEFEDELMDVSFSRISQQFEYRTVQCFVSK
jgi:hypothetical protein